MIKKFNIFFTVFLALAVGGSVQAGTSALKGAAPVAFSVADILPGRSLPDHERLVYRIKWLGITAGELVTEIKGHTKFNGRDCYLIEASAHTVGFVSTIYRVDDHYRSYLDAEKFYSLRHEERRSEGHYRKDSATDFDHVKGKAHFRNAIDKSEKVFDIPPGIQDNLTAAYIARLLPLAPEKMFRFKMCNSERVYDLYLAIQQRSRIGRRTVLHIVPFAKINGQRYREGRASGYVTDDDRRVPLLTVIKAPVFTKVTARLVE